MEALTELVGGEPDALRVRDGVSADLDGTMEGIAIVLTDACLADCIEKLGAAADYPSTDDLNEVLPGIIERHDPCNSHHARSDDRWRGSCRSNHPRNSQI